MTMECSEALNELAAALAKAQSQVKGAAKDSTNPFFRSKYADLAAVWEACRTALTNHGLAVVQSPSTAFTGSPEIYTAKSKSGEDRSGVRIATTVSVVTRLIHSSGQWIQGTTSAMLPAADPQAVGSAITYLRRYALAAMVGVAPEDDDGEATTRPVPAAKRHSQADDYEPEDTTPVKAVPVNLDSVIPFGKHKGKTLQEVGPDYFEHIAGKLRADDHPHAPTKAFVEGALLAFFPEALTKDTPEELELDARLAKGGK